MARPGDALHLVVPGLLETVTGGYIYDRRIVSALKTAGHTVYIHSVSPSFPYPGESDLDAADRVLGRIPDGARVVIDGLALGAMPGQVQRHQGRLRCLALIHHPLALETGLSEFDRMQFHASETRALAAVQGVIVTSEHTAGALGPYGVDPARIAVVEPGLDPVSPPVRMPTEAVRLVSVANVTARKGHLDLVRALGTLGHLSWTLRIAGSTSRDPGYATRVIELVDSMGLAERVTFLGEIDTGGLGRLYASSEIFVLPSFHEGYGMAFAEAAAWGLPAVGYRSGAVADTVAQGTGILVEAGAIDALAEAIATLVQKPAMRRRMGDKAAECAARRPDWDQAAARFLESVDRLTR